VLNTTVQSASYKIKTWSMFIQIWPRRITLPAVLSGVKYSDYLSDVIDVLLSMRKCLIMYPVACKKCMCEWLSWMRALVKHTVIQVYVQWFPSINFQGQVAYLSLGQSCIRPICGKKGFCPAVFSLFVHSTKQKMDRRANTYRQSHILSQTQRYKCAETHHERATDKRQQVAANW